MRWRMRMLSADERQRNVWYPPGSHAETSNDADLLRRHLGLQLLNFAVPIIRSLRQLLRNLELRFWDSRLLGWLLDPRRPYVLTRVEEDDAWYEVGRYRTFEEAQSAAENHRRICDLPHPAQGVNLDCVRGEWEWATEWRRQENHRWRRDLRSGEYYLIRSLIGP